MRPWLQAWKTGGFTHKDRVAAMTMAGTGVSSTRTDVSFRGLQLTIDEPPARGGEDAGPTPPVAMLAALIGCTNRISHKIAEANGVRHWEMTVGLEATFDRSGVNLVEEVDIPFRRINLTIDATDAEVDKIKTDLRKFCPISKILRQAGTEIEEEWTVRRL